MAAVAWRGSLQGRIPEILRRFVEGRITYQACIAALDDALDSFMMTMRPDELEEAQSVTNANKLVLQALRDLE